MGDTGLGKGAKEGQGRFRLRAVRTGETTLYDGERQVIAASRPRRSRPSPSASSPRSA